MVAYTGRLPGPDGHLLAYDISSGAGRAPAPKAGVVFLHGLASDRKGNKAAAIADLCAARGYDFARFDMYGHGESTGRFEDGGPSRWCADTLRVLDELTRGPQVLIGSSMGGWIMLLAALARPTRVAGLIGIAAAPDFTHDLLLESLTDVQRTTLLRDGAIDTPSDYGGPPMRISKHLIEDGARHMLLGGPIDVRCPVHLLHGQRDTSVPWQRSLRIAERLASDDVTITLIKDGDHRLSRPQDLGVLCAAIDSMVGST